MIDNRELLKYAALAAGHTIEFTVDAAGDTHCWYGDRFTCIPWNPLVYNADAFELMVQLKLRINYDTVIEYDVVEVFGPERDDFSCDCTTETIEEDQCASVRRAIVRAAARIGKQMLDSK